jgi:beta-ribofuranosylaminobenzene 5'-phosphate synthase
MTTTPIRLRGFPRLHLGLLDVGNATARRYGGCGLALDFPSPLIEADASSTIELEGFECIDSRTRAVIQQALDRLASENRAAVARLRLIDCPPQHVGLGVTTSLILTTLVATCYANGLRVDRALLQHLSGRGATSGVGINSFFSGGLIVDDGHDARFGERHLPSSVERSHYTPSVNTRVRIPADWRFALLVAPGRRVHGKTEVKFFRTHTPVPREEAEECIAAAYHGVVPAFRYGCLTTLNTSLNKLHEIGLKARELRAQAKTVQSLYDSLKDISEMAVGLSSLGPMLFLAHRYGDSRIEGILTEAANDFQASILGVVGGRNSGYQARAMEHARSASERT